MSHTFPTPEEEADEMCKECRDMGTLYVIDYGHERLCPACSGGANLGNASELHALLVRLSQGNPLRREGQR